MTYKSTLYFIFLLILCTACSDTTFITPEYLKIYLHENNNSKNILVLKAFPTSDNGLVIFSLKGNKSSVYDTSNGMEVVRLGPNGKVIWREDYLDLKEGFSSNIHQVGDNYHLFWNDYSETTHLSFTPKASGSVTDAFLFKQETISCNLAPYEMGASYYIMPDQDNDFYSLQFRLESEQLSSFFLKTSDNTASFVSQYWTDSKFFFNNADYTSFVENQSDYLTIKSFNKTHYASVPYNNMFAIIEIGNQTPIYSSKNYWPFSTCIYDGGIAAILTPKKLNDEEGLVYFIPKIDLNTYNQDFSSLAHKRLLEDFSTESAIHIKQFDTNFLVAGTSPSGSIEVKLFNPKAELLTEKTFGADNRYTLVSVLENTDKSHIMLVGYTQVSSHYQRAFVIKILKSELL